MGATCPKCGKIYPSGNTVMVCSCGYVRKRKIDPRKSSGIRKMST